MGACRRLTHIAADAVTVRPGTVAAVTPPPGTAPGKAVTLQFHDNTLLPLLLGDHDRHLARIEQAMGVRLSCRGNRLAISGDAMRVDAVQAVLQGLWQKLERGQAVGRPEVEAAIKLADLDADPRLPLSDLPAIRTRRGAVGPRSPGQATYIEALARHEMVFGIGPAGTGKTYLAVPAGWTASCCPARRWRRASGWASCPAT
jgi:phosphate starvation-inducible PhoH-like protein